MYSYADKENPSCFLGARAPIASEVALDLIAQVSCTVVDRAPLFLRLCEIARQVRHAFSADGCVIRELVGQCLHLSACSGIPEEQLPGILPAQSGLAMQVLSEKKALAVFDAPNNSVTASLHSAAEGKWFQFSSYAGSPMLVQRKPVGIVAVYACDPARRFSDSDLHFLQIVANHLGIVMQNERAYKELKLQRDQLTTSLEERRQVEIELRARIECLEQSLARESSPR